jgi:hypothetical protein
MLSQYNISPGLSSSHNSNSLFGRVDMVALGLYFILVLVGILSITSASYDAEVGSFFSFKHNYI